MATTSSVNENARTHTPGPWRWMNPTTLVGDHGRRPVVLSWGRDGILARGSDGLLQSFDIDSPDARLIVAAPDLLENARLVLKGFAAGAFARDVTGDDRSDWAVKALPYITALARLEAAIKRAGGAR